MRGCLARGQRAWRPVAARAISVTDRQAQLKGVGADHRGGTPLASHYLARQLADLRSRYPELVIEIIASSKSLDPGAAGPPTSPCAWPARPTATWWCVAWAGLACSVYGPEKPLLCSSWQTAPWVGYERALDQLPDVLAVRAGRLAQRDVSLQQHRRAGQRGGGRPRAGHPYRAWSAASAGLRCLSGDQAVPQLRDLAGAARELRDVPPRPRRRRLAGPNALLCRDETPIAPSHCLIRPPQPLCAALRAGHPLPALSRAPAAPHLVAFLRPVSGYHTLGAPQAPTQPRRPGAARSHERHPGSLRFSAGPPIRLRAARAATAQLVASDDAPAPRPVMPSGPTLSPTPR